MCPAGQIEVPSLLNVLMIIYNFPGQMPIFNKKLMHNSFHNSYVAGYNNTWIIFELKVVVIIPTLKIHIGKKDTKYL